MTKAYHIRFDATHKAVKQNIRLDGSKSISNRALIIAALCAGQCDLSHLSTSDDTKAMQVALTGDGKLVDVGAAGTTMRFLTAYFSLQAGTHLLTGSKRMQERPIGVLVDALNHLGASISYEKKDGCPPLIIEGKQLYGGLVEMNAGVSSQYLSALLLIAPTLPKGLSLKLIGRLVSRPYLEMTLRLMGHYGIEHAWDEDTIHVLAQDYRAKSLQVEADWSAASYHYTIAAFADELDLELHGLFKKSLQGDSVLAEMMRFFGIRSQFKGDVVSLTKRKATGTTAVFKYDFVRCPDIAQSLAVVCAGLDRAAEMSGLITLAIKETDRTAALRTELAKLGCDFNGAGDEWRFTPAPNGIVKHLAGSVPSFATYHDHRMAMAFAPLAMKIPQGVIIEDPMVVTKSYPAYWDDLKQLGFSIEVI